MLAVAAGTGIVAIVIKKNGDDALEAALKLSDNVVKQADDAKGLVDDIVTENSILNDLATQFRDGNIDPKDLRKEGFSPEDIADIEARSKSLRPRQYDSAKIIDDISKSKENYRNALEAVRQNPGDAIAIKLLEEATEQLNSISKAFEELRRLERGGN